ncbi:uncharacterized protein PHACADRAFT_140891 [Phanerochaete carnosa HHB-10118-sp]|uniref:F-box domain-containing protein n=1 Tax=Phanerochaete carnosa (strain HHB-10118-sp) TaxID=650164 RepID=K5VXG1_PHACS|nr:uncharacterized protein PHACADRAFT_140891 [Phanerochaete carnosa HHB-10118-sp]EKM56263.1 hypothetical protein PHACADRAFT_140891 [Phanerochaete carnosa HHB-10118-sp]
MSVTEDIPAELWLSIFELMDSPVDLNNVLRTCRRFHNCALRALHRNLVWKRPEDFVHNSPIWLEDPGLPAGVHSLEMHISTLPDDVPGTLVDAAGLTFTRDDAAQFPELDDEPFWLFPEVDQQMHHTYATPGVYGVLMNRLATFTNLQDLTLRNLFVTDELFGSLFQLPSLRKLHVEFCLFPRRHSITHRDFSALPITDLTLLNLRRQVLNAGRHGHDLHAFADMDEDIEYGLALASAKTLRSLRVDSTADVFATIYRRRIQGVFVYNIPPSLSALYIQRKQVVEGVVQPIFHAEQLFPNAVYSIMERCPTITTVSLAYALPKHTSFPKPEALPNLTHCEGFLDAVAAMTTNRPLKAISILRSDTSPDGILELLARKARHHPRLQMLSLHCKTWDLEILDAICQLFPQLRKLKLTFDIREPGKLWEHNDYWNGIQPFGPHYLYRLEHLHTAYIYAAPTNGKPEHPKFLFDNTFETAEEEIQNLVIPWNRYCTKLREVQLHAGYVMRRGFEGDVWRLREVHELKEGCTFDY